MAKKAFKMPALGVILRLAAALAAIAAFCMMFATQLDYEFSSILGGSTTHIGAFGDADNDVKALVGVIIGYILMLVAGLGGVASALLVKNKKIDMAVAALCAVMAVVGVVLVFTAIPQWKDLNGDASFSGGSYASGTYKLAAGPVVGGILGIVIALVEAASIAVDLKKK